MSQTDRQARQTTLFQPEHPAGRVLPVEKLHSTTDTELLDDGSRWGLFQGDAYDLLPRLPADSVDLIVTSPPYWGQRSYGNSHNWSILDEWRDSAGGGAVPPDYDWYRSHGGVLGLEPIPDWFILHLAEIFERAKSCLKPMGSVWVNLGDTYFARWSSIRENGRQGLGDQSRKRRRVPMGGYRQEKQLLMIPARFAVAMQERRWILRNDLIWHKPNVPPRPEKDRLRLAHEHFFHFVNRPKEGRARYYYDLSACEDGARDVVTCSVRPGEGGHTATFPLELVRPRIASSCCPDGLVLDPFCGSGRALLAAVALGRRAIGFDLSAEFLSATQESLKGWWDSNGWQL
jgi:DNA modification methylase